MKEKRPVLPGEEVAAVEEFRPPTARSRKTA
jgi:hypothetical protein